MDSEELLLKLNEAGVVEDDGETVNLSESFEETLETYLELVERTPSKKLAEKALEVVDDVPEEDLKNAFSQHDEGTVARYLAVRAETDLDDENAMVATQALKELIDPTIAKCGKCGFDAPVGGEEWEEVDDPAMGSLTRCPECGSTDVRIET